MRFEDGSTVSELIDGAAARFRAAGVIKPKREANRLWAWMSRTTPGDAWLAGERATDRDQAAAFEAAVTRRAAGEPMAYVLGTAGFRRLELRSDRRALIPRPETEGLVDIALSKVRTGRALDVGTGSGCVALALAQEGTFDLVVGVDLSQPALTLAAENVRDTRYPVSLLRSDLVEGLRPASFDLLVTNPPYLTDAEYQALDAAVKTWEPRGALWSGADGLEATRRILRRGLELMVSGGCIVMELDFRRSMTAAELARDAGWAEVHVRDDLFGRPRYLSARRS